MQALSLVLRTYTSPILGVVGWSCNVHSLMLHASPIKILQDLAVQALWLVLSPSLVLWGGGEIAIFTLWCFMVLPTKISSHCVGPLACFKSFFWNIELVNR